MAGTNPRIDAAEFDRVAALCRWKPHSLAIARWILVDGLSIAQTAKSFGVSAPHARILMHRFHARAEKERLVSFMKQEPPKQNTPLEPFSSEITTLQEKGYSAEQIVEYLKRNGVATNAAKVRKFIRSIRA
ncbi:hypothetical protein ABQY58_025000 (plasmid) [Xanthomonas hortorum pv. hederae]|uniref:hypothetical protein n=1 Tax=Xanthomonas hortorum TaxID=56454 RepID=UPI0032E8BA92